ncbi:MAG: ABC transporter ATP-binding protein [Candidatus Thermoplasmatota archaeon]|jgi:ABC-2 type transport system ATP-binding protein|nr:ABC transporter ATP-binding protein [Candidatus Thermoplasmatota archaeon]MCL5984703.1 ABC transporter ATP-binding protein [Candidatus Thermoplasmatota archaeon]
MSEAPLQIEGLRVTYGDVVAVEKLDLGLREGEIYGLIGSNGAGKTSAIKSVMGLLVPSSGKVRVFGKDPVPEGIFTRSVTGYVPEVSILYDALTPREYLEFVASVRGLSGFDDRLVDFTLALQIDGEMDRAISTLSNGTRQKVLVVSALLHQPRLLILDEPFNSLDPRSVRIMRDLLGAYVKNGKRTILFSTHTMEVAEKLCHRVGVLDRGLLRGEGTLTELRQQVGLPSASLEDIFLELTTDREQLSKIVSRLEAA